MHRRIKKETFKYLPRKTIHGGGWGGEAGGEEEVEEEVGEEEAQEEDQEEKIEKNRKFKKQL